MPRPGHPIATEDQREVEREALRLFDHPALRRARDEVRADWLEKAAPSPEMRERFDAAFEEVAFCAAVWSQNRDPLRPRVVTITRLEHELDGRRVPGSRYGLDNPDSIYRVIPIDGHRRYRIHGRVPERRLTENPFTLWDGEMNTVANFDGRDLEVGPDGRFAIDVDGDPAGSRRNHVRSSPESCEFFVRDVLLDWERDRPNELAIERLGPSVAADPADDDLRARLAAGLLRRHAENTLRWNQQALQHPANTLEFRIDRDRDGALRDQLYLLGHFRLRDEEALVLDVHLGGAAYFIAPITNLWGTSNDVIRRTASLNNVQSVANPDGTLTFVVSVADPGVHNWVDPCDLHEGILTLRWAEFAAGRPSPELSARCRVVPLAHLRSELPAGTRFVGPVERREQQARRARSYAWRLEEDEAG